MESLRSKCFDIRLDVRSVDVRSKVGAKETLPVRYPLAYHVRCTFKYFGK